MIILFSQVLLFSKNVLFSSTEPLVLDLRMFRKPSLQGLLYLIKFDRL